MRTLFIGDIHGCAAEFRRMLEALAYDDTSDRLFLAGDAFTKGPDPLKVWNLIRQTRARMVMGNHDVKVIEWLKEHLAGRPPSFKSPDQKVTLNRLAPVAGTLLPWMEALPLWIEEERFLLVHAGINPEKGLAGTTRAEFLAIRTWPPTGGLVGPRWHDALSPDRHRLIIFGHDAPVGLVVKRRRDGTPYVIGLDSGCVYGRQLSAYILEEDRIVQVERRAG